jgi:hypothetical protein
MDPANYAAPGPCLLIDGNGGFVDTDGDGLNDCEEAFLHTNPRLVDTDGDHIPDLIEVLNGLDPLDPNDALEDSDGDGVRNIDEIRNHTNPHLVPPPGGDGALQYVYDVGSPVAQADGSNCYDFTVGNVQMLTTGRGTQSMLGRNRIMVYFLDGPTDQAVTLDAPKVACIDTRFVDGVVKAPANGIIHLTPADFRPLNCMSGTNCVAFDARLHCRDLTGETSVPDMMPHDSAIGDLPARDMAPGDLAAGAPDL